MCLGSLKSKGGIKSILPSFFFQKPSDTRPHFLGETESVGLGFDTRQYREQANKSPS